MAELEKVEFVKAELPKAESPKVEFKSKDGALTAAELLTFGILPPEPDKPTPETPDHKLPVSEAEEQSVSQD
jgi:hypothetical protein